MEEKYVICLQPELGSMTFLGSWDILLVCPLLSPPCSFRALPQTALYLHLSTNVGVLQGFIFSPLLSSPYIATDKFEYPRGRAEIHTAG